MIGRRALFYSAAPVGLALLGAGWTASARADSTNRWRKVVDISGQKKEQKKK
jgi:hypothetical protein